MCHHLQAFHQVAIDEEDWGSALLLVPSPDSVWREDFGGSELEPTAAHQAMKGLKGQQKTGGGKGGDADEGLPPARGALRAPTELQPSGPALPVQAIGSPSAAVMSQATLSARPSLA